MAKSLSNLYDNITEGLHRIKCKLKYDGKNCETCVVKCKYCKLQQKLSMKVRWKVKRKIF